jgi:hypothetical protein
LLGGERETALTLELPFPAPEPRWLRVVDDYGEIGAGVSAARSVLAENGSEYLIKGPSLTPQYPYVAANEYIAAELARVIGLPILDHGVVDFGGQPCFAASLMPSGTFYPQITAEIFARCANLDQVYALVVFDTWICNSDRHAGNLLVRRVRPRGQAEERHFLLVNDHSHCLMIDRGPADLGALLDTTPERYVWLPFLADAITDPDSLGAAISTVEGVSEAHIRAIVEGLPESWLAPGDRADVERFLLERQTRLRTIFNQNRACFPNLRGGPQ